VIDPDRSVLPNRTTFVVATCAHAIPDIPDGRMVGKRCLLRTRTMTLSEARGTRWTPAAKLVRRAANHLANNTRLLHYHRALAEKASTGFRTRGAL
jgi:hypothetical protein